MDLKCSLSALLLCVVVVHSSPVLKYKFFDEYLLHLERKQQSIIVEEIDFKISSPSLYRTGASRSKEEKCCLLGQMAGEKGFHCSVRFYASRIVRRNYNRAHNKRIPVLLRGKADPAADKLMRTFGQCVANRGAIFHKCCRHSAMQ